MNRNVINERRWFGISVARKKDNVCNNQKQRASLETALFSTGICSYTVARPPSSIKKNSTFSKSIAQRKKFLTFLAQSSSKNDKKLAKSIVFTVCIWVFAWNAAVRTICCWIFHQLPKYQQRRTDKLLFSTWNVFIHGTISCHFPNYRHDEVNAHILLHNNLKQSNWCDFKWKNRR